MQRKKQAHGFHAWRLSFSALCGHWPILRWDLHGLAWCVPGLLWWLGGSQQDWARLVADMDCQPRACLMHASLVALHATCRRCLGGLACLVSLLFPLSLALGLALWMVFMPNYQGRFRFHARDDSLVVSATRSSRCLDGSQPLGSLNGWSPH